MEAPTELYVGTGIVLGAFILMLVNLNREYKERQRLEDGHDRAARRELEWHWNSDRNKDVENIPAKTPLNEGLSRRSAQP